VKHRASRKFWKYYNELPEDIQDTADKNYELLKVSPQHPSLHFKKVGDFWSARVGLGHRALAIEEADDLVWFWIGKHDEYDRLIGG
jgi:hypothetical protein